MRELAYIVGDGDLSIDRTLKMLIVKKTILIFMGLTKGGMGILVDEHGKKYTVPMKNIKFK